MATKLDLADAQLIGFAHAKNGYSIEQLAESMGLTKKEWKKLKQQYPKVLKQTDEQALDAFFQSK